MLGLFVDAVTVGLPVAVIWVLLYGRLDAFAGGCSRRVFVAGSAAGALAGLIVTVLRRRTDWIAWEASLVLLLPVVIGAAAAVVVAGSWRPARVGRRGRAETGVLVALASAVLFLGLPEAFMLVAGIAAPGVVGLTSEAVMNLAGLVLGLGLAATTAGVLHRAGTEAAPAARRAGLAVGATAYAAAQATVLLQISLARRLIDVPAEVFAAAVWLVNREWVFTIGMLAAALIPVMSAAVVRAPLPPPANPAEARLQRAASRSRRRFLAASAATLGLVALTLTVGRRLADATVELSPPEPYEQDGERVWTSLDALDDGHLHRFAYPGPGGTEVRFFAIRKAPGVFVAVLDACEICGPSGYFERSGMVICAMCDVAMNIATLGFRGGCNPIPIDYEIAAGRLAIARTTLDGAVGVFA